MKLPKAIQDDLDRIAEMNQGEPVVFPPIPWQVYPMPEKYQCIKDIVFKVTPQRPLLLDVYLPDKAPAKPLPLVVFIHGGGWVFGDKTCCPPAPMVGRGFIAASISYRYSSEAIFPAQIEDARAAIRYLRAHAAEYHIDPDRIGVWGHSAGAHLCSLLGTSAHVSEFNGDDAENAQFPNAVQAVCNMSGPADLTYGTDVDRDRYPTLVDCLEWLVGGRLDTEGEMLRMASPITYVTGEEPPFLTVFGENDDVVPCHQGILLHEALQKAGADSTLIITKNDAHGVESFSAETAFQFFEEKLG